MVASRIVGASALHDKTQKMACKNTIVGYHPVGAPHTYVNRRWGNPARTQHNSVLRQRVVHEYLRADKLRKGWGFQVSTWNVDSLTGKAGQLIETLVDVPCIQETRWRGNGCRFFGAKGERYKLFWMGGKEI